MKNKELVDRILLQIKHDVEIKDLTALDELFTLLLKRPKFGGKKLTIRELLKGYLSEEVE